MKTRTDTYLIFETRSVISDTSVGLRFFIWEVRILVSIPRAPLRSNFPWGKKEEVGSRRGQKGNRLHLLEETLLTRRAFAFKYRPFPILRALPPMMSRPMDLCPLTWCRLHALLRQCHGGSRRPRFSRCSLPSPADRGPGTIQTLGLYTLPQVSEYPDCPTPGL